MKYTVSVLVLGMLVLQSCIMSKTEESQETKTVETGPQDTLPRVTGIGGIFFKGNHPDSLNKWYAEQLGINVSEHGAPFEFRNGNNPNEINYLIWAVHDSNTTYMDPSKAPFMINYRVQHIEKLVDQLAKNGTTIVDSIADYPYGKFVHVLDPEGNILELWEPVDSVLTTMGGETTK
ncbi:MAG: VOC family protein [Crocinitomicaceae bacterium]